MTVEVVPHQNGVVLANGDLINGNSNPGVAAKKSRESERRRRRRKQKKNNKASQAQTDLTNGTDGGDSDAGDDDAKENTNPQHVGLLSSVEIARVWELKFVQIVGSCYVHDVCS
ncbi:hypothetical protein SLEP1_g28221 [Rubroshorea leprosula]|uniref:Uncharacterized protein n=1 Tax=Rubroshorea leprosula TaxID=152421 RepID=A0AAV5K2D1_9ROSI|nr:hypothetical protein SLEP1_g28221 [Rubroshorea leprosula]